MAGEKICTIADCGNPTCAHGLCHKHYARLRRTGDPEGFLPGFKDRRRHVARWVDQYCLSFAGDECLSWPFARDKQNGYARMSGWDTDKQRGRAFSAARVICEKVYGPPPEPWYEAAHTCGKGGEACVNPRHLRWATPADNRADKRLHGTRSVGTKHPSAKLTDEQVAYVRAMRGKIKQVDLARELGVSHAIISRIYSGRAYE
jgi:hypothetical protein